MSESCSDPCHGLTKMSFWCSDNPCNIGQGESPFKCECEVNGGAVAGIVIACVVVLVTITCVVCCYIYQRNRRMQQVAVQGTSSTAIPQTTVTTTTFTYNPQQQQLQPAVYNGYPSGAATGGYPAQMMQPVQPAYGGYNPTPGYVAAPQPTFASTDGAYMYGGGAPQPGQQPQVVFYGGAPPPVSPTYNVQNPITRL